MNKKEILAVHEQDLEKILKRLGLFDEFENKKLKCSVCNKILTKENFGCVYPEREKIKACCSDLECLDRVKEITQ